MQKCDQILLFIYDVHRENNYNKSAVFPARMKVSCFFFFIIICILFIDFKNSDNNI